MDCTNCSKPDAGYELPGKSYFGTRSIRSGSVQNFCNQDCYNKWWNDLTWHLDTLDERMNSNIHFKRTNGLEGTYKGKRAHASWNGLEARHILGEYEFENRRPHPETCTGCCLS